MKTISDDTPQLSDRAWQAWQWKNRQRDKVAAARRLKFLKLVLGLAVVAALVQGLTG